MSDYVEQILEELCDASDDCVWAELRGVGDDEKNAIKKFQDTWDNAVEKLTKPTISDYLEVNKEMIDKTGCKVVTIASLRKFGGLENE